MIPVVPIDLTKRYDLYCIVQGEQLLYEDVKIIDIRILEQRRTQFSSALLGGFLEIESRDGTRTMIRSHILHTICEHGAKPSYKVLRTRKTEGEA